VPEAGDPTRQKGEEERKRERVRKEGKKRIPGARETEPPPKKEGT